MKTCGAIALACVLAVTAWPWDKKQKKEQETQTLQLPRELPTALAVETRKLVFEVSPLSSKGLLSQQVRDGLRALQRSAGGTAVRLRAFVAGTGDVRRVRDMVSEAYTARRLPLPVLTVVLVGALPLEGAQVVFESTAVAKKDVNPHGLAFISGQVATSDDPLGPVEPLASKALDGLRTAVSTAGVTSGDVLRVTCFLSSLEDITKVRTMFERAYPGAVRNYVQAQRVPSRGIAECEAVARLSSPPASPLEMRHAGSAPPSPHYSQIAMVAAPQVVLTGMQAAFGFQDADARLAFERLDKVLAQSGSSLKHAAFAGFYPLSAGIAQQVRKIRADFIDPQHPPAATMLPFESLPAMDAGFAVDVIAVKQ
ncbi:MAG TPA: RidA family protein [Bryobacteraceae bacterium]|nr:RidA family protein [Bryobacteraceae bacterium]